MSNRLWVGLVGPAGAGKTTAAQCLTKRGFARERFAGPLKDMMRAVGLTDEQVEGDLKEEPCELLCGKSPRVAMQTLGTEWGRETIGQDIWVRLWLHRVRHMGLVVADDVRFPNEVAAIRNYADKSVIIRIERPDVTGTQHSNHVSETHELPFDALVLNNGTPDDLARKIFSMVQALT